MNSWFLEQFLNPLTGYMVLALCIALILKEFALHSTAQRLAINLVAVVVLVGVSWLFVWSLYWPTIRG